ncbi:transposase IS66-like protein [Rhizobium azibense]|uniref:Transposase IS66-like protein n=1 Tax=Rhizobium azibense TaxID=1136135 RepID=A0A4R3QJW5_9HYPH|nr:transposase IS66-like protein [Rhizobium azibense]
MHLTSAQFSALFEGLDWKRVHAPSDDRALAYLADVLTRIVNGHPNSQLNDLLPWTYAASTTPKAWLRAPLLRAES